MVFSKQKIQAKKGSVKKKRKQHKPMDPMKNEKFAKKKVSWKKAKQITKPQNLLLEWLKCSDRRAKRCQTQKKEIKANALPHLLMHILYGGTLAFRQKLSAVSYERIY